MKALWIAACIGLFTGCEVRHRVPENGTIRTTRYDSVLKRNLQQETTLKNGRAVSAVAKYESGAKAFEWLFDETDPHIMHAGYFYEDGTLMRRMQYWNDTLMRHEEWHENGMKRMDFVHARNGTQRVTRWHENGIKKEDAEWRGNMRNGAWMEWDSNGVRIRNEHYSNGKKIN